MFSQRLSWNLPPNRLSRLREQKREAGAAIVDLTESNPTRAQLEYPQTEILSCLADRRALIYEPLPQGPETTRRAIARYYRQRGREVDIQDMILTASTSEAYAFLFKLLANPGDQVLVPRPSYPLFDYLAAAESVQPVSYSLFYDGSWIIDWSHLEKIATSRARALLVVHPGNPTGSYLKRHDLDNLVDFCRERGLALVADEVFLDYPLREGLEHAGSLAENREIVTFVLSGLSKVAGLPQMKLAWICIGGPQRLRQDTRERLEHVSDLYLSVGASAQHIGESLVELASRIQPVIANRIRSNCASLHKITAGSPIDVLDAEGGWYAILRCPALRTSEEWALELLENDHVYLHPGYLFDLPIEACLVVSLLTPPEPFLSGVQLLLRRVAGTLSDSPQTRQ